MKLKLTSWNVNGIRAVLKKDFMKFFNKNNSDIFCLQETKAHPDQVDIMTFGILQRKRDTREQQFLAKKNHTKY